MIPKMTFKVTVRRKRSRPIKGGVIGKTVELWAQRASAARALEKFMNENIELDQYEQLARESFLQRLKQAMLSNDGYVLCHWESEGNIIVQHL